MGLARLLLMLSMLPVRLLSALSMLPVRLLTLLSVRFVQSLLLRSMSLVVRLLSSLPSPALLFWTNHAPDRTSAIVQRLFGSGSNMPSRRQRAEGRIQGAATKHLLRSKPPAFDENVHTDE